LYLYVFKKYKFFVEVYFFKKVHTPINYYIQKIIDLFYFV
jgi:hypothetical protein